MKKIILSFLVAAMCALPVFGLAACGDEDQSSNGLQFGVKYIDAYDLGKEESEQEYYIFSYNGSGYYNTSEFKYTFTDKEYSGVTCFFKDSSAEIYSRIMSVSKDILMRVNSSGYRIYVNENYAKQLKDWAAK